MPRLRPLQRIIAFRVDDHDFIRLTALKSTFEDPTMRAAFEWLLTQPEVQRLIRERLENEQLQLRVEEEVIEVPSSFPEEPERESVFADLGYRD